MDCSLVARSLLREEKVKAEEKEEGTGSSNNSAGFFFSSLTCPSSIIRSVTANFDWRKLKMSQNLPRYPIRQFVNGRLIDERFSTSCIIKLFSGGRTIAEPRGARTQNLFKSF